jgi:dihydrodipicolinate synthase/N-acetylneuraminate lyase
MSTAPLAFRPRGIWAAVLLPIDAAGAIDWVALRDEIQFLTASGVAGLYTNGTAGEFHSQTEAEFDRLSALVAETSIAAGVPFQIGISATNGRLARERLKRVRTLGAAAVQFTLPDWWPPSDTETQAFVPGLAEAAPELPLILYNPPHAKRRLTLAEIAALRAAVPSLIGAKLPGGDAAWYAEMRASLPDFSVFTPGHMIASGRRAGAWGSYSNVACLSPAGAVRWWSQIETDPAAALALETRIQSFLADHVLPLRIKRGLSDAALDKAMAAAGGWGPVGPDLLWPYRGATADEVAAIAAALRRALPELTPAA